MAAGHVHPRRRLSHVHPLRARDLSRCRVRRRDDAPCRLRRAGGVARARRGACRLARRALRGQPVRDGANRPGLGPAGAAWRAARCHRASSVRAGSRSLRPRLAAAMARPVSDPRRRRHPAGLAAASRVTGSHRRPADRGRRAGTGARLARALRRAWPAGFRSEAGRVRHVSALGREPGPVRRAGAAPLAGGRRADHRGNLAADPAARGRRDLGRLVARADHARHDPVVCDRPLGARRVQQRQRRGARLRALRGPVRRMSRPRRAARRCSKTSSRGWAHPAYRRPRACAA